MSLYCLSISSRYGFVDCSGMARYRLRICRGKVGQYERGVKIGTTESVDKFCKTLDSQISFSYNCCSYLPPRCECRIYRSRSTIFQQSILPISPQPPSPNPQSDNNEFRPLLDGRSRIESPPRCFSNPW